LLHHQYSKKYTQNSLEGRLMTMHALGKHILAEYYSCDVNILNNLEMIKQSMLDAVIKSDATIIDSTFHQFSPQGVSGVIVIAESHMAIHTWPEYGYAAVDFFTCGNRVDPYKALDYMNKILNPARSSRKELMRGVIAHESQKLLEISL
jgi:S-adenosylmethionine decarboxylase proenzyme